MRIKKSLEEILEKKKDDYWEEDSKYDHWINYYIPFYHNTLGNVLDFQQLTYDKIRIVAKSKENINELKNYIFGGDVIVNLDNMPENYRSLFKQNKYENKYMEYNLGILPKQGNLQGAKKKIGNDWRIDLFLKTIDKYYRYNDEKILEQSKNRNNSDFTKNVLEYFSVPRYFDNGNNISSEIKDSQKIYNFCESFYGISCNMTKKLLLCPNDIEPKEYYNLIINFWNERKLKSRNKSVNKS